MRKNTSGFTIVELLIVIVVIAVLAAISIVAYSGIQARAQDSRRISDLQSIAKALELYKANTGTYPSVAYSGLGAQSGWEASAHEDAGQFLAPLRSGEYGFAAGVPVDPINNATEATFAEAGTNKSYSYYYYKYAAGANGCDASRGAYFILGALTTATTSTAKNPNSPGFTCSGGHNYQSWFSWVTGGYEK